MPPLHPSRRPHRLPGYDYATPGHYFLTVCIQHRLPLLGRMVGDQMLPSPAGRLVAQLWEEIATATPHVSLDTIQLMPDHLHAILCLSGDTVSLSQLVHRFKAVSTAQYADGVHQADWPPFPGRLWQRGFYDRVIRREEELARTRDYILQNPLRWSLKRQ